MLTTSYFLQTDFNDWDLKKAFLIYLEHHSFREAKKYMKDDLKLYSTSPVIGKKAANKANALLNQLDVSILCDVLFWMQSTLTSDLERISNIEKLERINASNC